MTEETGGSAFPIPNGCGRDEGMTLRDYFAAKAMQSMIASPHCPKEFDERELAFYSYQLADVMLEARK